MAMGTGQLSVLPGTAAPSLDRDDEVPAHQLSVSGSGVGLEEGLIYRLFCDFTRYEAAVGGPDPQIAMVHKMLEGRAIPERIWGAACYSTVYNVATAEVLWRTWPLAQTLKADVADIAAWLTGNWPGIATRTERRTVRTPEKMARCLKSFATWIDAKGWRGWGRNGWPIAWGEVTSIYSIGRYQGMKFLQALDRIGIEGCVQPDLRLKDGKSSRQTLEMLAIPPMPRAAWTVEGPAHLASLEAAAEQIRRDLPMSISPYELQVVLCEFKQAYVGKRQYPGRSIDSEAKYYWKIEVYWGDIDSTMWAARRELFPAVSLGETEGWEGPREELGALPAQYGYMWSDLEFSYRATAVLGDWAHPVRRV